MLAWGPRSPGFSVFENSGKLDKHLFVAMPTAGALGRGAYEEIVSPLVQSDLWWTPLLD
jgi:hypothetical protein